MVYAKMQSICETSLLSNNVKFPPPPPSDPSRTDLTFSEITGYILNQTRSVKVIEVPTHPSQESFCCFKKSNYMVNDVWDYIYKTSLIKFDSNDNVHSQMLKRVYKWISGSDAPATFEDPNWMKIGFQTNRPVIDFRGGGIFTLLVPFWFFNNCVNVSTEFLEIVKQSNFPIMLVLNVITCNAFESISTTNILQSVKTEIEMWNMIFIIFAGIVKNIMNEMKTNNFNISKDSDILYKIISRSVSNVKRTYNIGKKIVSDSH